MKQDYGMFVFCLLACFSSARPPLHQTMPLEFFFCTTPLTQIPSQIVAVWCQITRSPSPIPKSCRHFVYMDICITTYEAVLSHFLYQFQLICLFFFPAWTGFSIITWNDVDSAQVCFSITLLQLLMVCIFKEYILHKKMRERGEKQYVPFLKNTKKSSFTPAIGTHPHITSMIYINS